MGDTIINVDKGRSREVAGSILKKFKSNVMNVSTRINSEHNVAAQILYNDTAELHNLLENIKAMPYVTDLQWSEMVEMIGDNSPSVIASFFNRSKQRWAQNGWYFHLDYFFGILDYAETGRKKDNYEDAGENNE